MEQTLLEILICIAVALFEIASLVALVCIGLFGIWLHRRLREQWHKRQLKRGFKAMWKGCSQAMYYTYRIKE